MLAEVDIPDGGWGWVIVACSFLIHMFVVGTMYALSVVYVAWLDYFEDGKGVTSWIISVAVAVMFGIGPLPGFLSKKIGNRGVVILGGFLMSSGLAMSYFAANVYFLVVSIGIITGTGAGCCYLPSISMVAMYFTTKRSIAMGIASSGLGAGTFCMAPLLDWLLDYYGWRGCMLILSGISLNMCVIGAMMRPLKQNPKCESNRLLTDVDIQSGSSLSLPPRNDMMKECNISEKYVSDCGDHYNHLHKDNCFDTRTSYDNAMYNQLPTSEVEYTAMHSAYPSFEVHQHDSLNKSAESKSVTDNEIQSNFIDLSHVNLKTFTTKSCKSHENGSCSIDGYNFVSLSDDKNLCRKVIDLGENYEKRIDESGSTEIPTPDRTKLFLSEKLYFSQMEVCYNGKSPSMLSVDVTNNMSGLNDMQVMMSGSIGSLVFMDKTLRERPRNCFHSQDIVIIPHSAPAPAASTATIAIVQPVTAQEIPDQKDGIEKSANIKHRASFRTYVNLVKDGTFIVFGISNFLTNVSFFMPVLYMVDRALSSGVKKGDSAMLISLYGAGNIFGKLTSGWLADRKLVDRLFYYIGSIIITGAATCVSPLCGSSHELHSLYAVTFGCFIGAYVTLLPLVTVDLMGLSLLSDSFALLLCFMGIATAFGTPVAGLVFDWTGSYAISFVLHGIILVISVLMLTPLLVSRRRQTSVA